MIKAGKLFSLILVVCLLCSVIPGFYGVASAVGEIPLSISIDSYSSGTLSISWDGSVPGVDTVDLLYHTPDNIDNTTAVSHDVALQPDASSAQISGLRNDFIYDIRIQLRNSGIVVAEGLLYFLSDITFSSTIVDETVVDTDPPGFDPPYDPKGGREIGTKPRLSLKWNIPKVFNGSFFDYTQNSLGYMQGQINTVYNEGRVLSSLNYRINISPNPTDMSLDDAVIVDGTTNTAYVAGYADDRATVGVNNGSASIDLMGRASETAEPPATSNGILGHRQIYPGTVYYMTVQPVFDDYTDAVMLDKGASPLAGKFYSYTPIRFQLSKDDSGNVYAKIFTVNQNSLQMPDLYYEVQSNTTNSEYGWLTKAKIDPDYFKDSNGNYQEFGIVPIIGVSPNNNIYYRIVASSDSNDVIKSQSMPYKMAQDTSRPPIPKGISIVRRTLVKSGGKTSTDVTISWDKPANWDEIKMNSDPATDVYFNIILNISQTEILQPPYPPLNDGMGTDDYPAKYRLVRYINARSSWDGIGADPDPARDKIVENGNKLEYTLKGLEMFKWTDLNGNLTGFPITLPDELKPESGYPDYLLPNTVYYMQMYTTKGVPGTESGSSDRSITASFTTLSGTVKDVPLPNNFMQCSNNGNTVAVDNTGKVTNTVKLQFDQIQSIDWSDFDPTPLTTADNKIYYDLFMSTDTDPMTFTLIGSNDPAMAAENNVFFEPVVAQSDFYEATVSSFNIGHAVTSFGSGLTPNTTYYFKVGTRLVMPQDPAAPAVKFSSPTYILPVTTLKGDIKPPDPSDRIPTAPLDFAVAKDQSGNLRISGTSVTFNWKREEDDVQYILVCTSSRLPMDATPEMYLNDPVYQDFKTGFGFLDEGIILDPDGLQPDYFKYDRAGKICTLTVNKGIFPNRLYYFSIRAVRKPAGKSSVWVSIPVTTILIDAPTALAPVNDPETGFFWADSDADIQPEDYKIYIKGPGDKDYKPVSRSQSTVVRDGNTIERDGERCFVYYCRINNLKNNTTYSAAVYKGKDNSTLVFEDDALYTKDGFHQVQVRWKGIAGYEYEVAIKAADATAYTTLSDSDFETYADISGISHPYYFEESLQTNSSEYGYFYATIKSVPVTLPDGRIERRPLMSNVKYQIKVRAVKDMPGEIEPACSKYAGPAEVRTEFSQSDYDSGEEQKNRDITFLDRVKEIERKPFWRMAISSSAADKIFLKGDRVMDVIRNSGNFPVTVDLSEFAASSDADIIYIPAGLIKVLNTEGKGFAIRTSDSELMFTPETLKLDDMGEITTVKSKAGVNDVFLKLTSVCSGNPQTGFPSGTKKASKVNDIRLQALGSSITDAKLKEMFNDRLYNNETGLVKKKEIALAGVYGSKISKDPAGFNEYLDELVNDVEVDLSLYINDVVEGARGIHGMVAAEEPVKKFSGAMYVKLPYTAKTGFKLPYALNDGSAAWQRISNNVTDLKNALGFYITAPGKYAVLASAATAGDVPGDHWAKASIDKLMAKYDLSNVFSGISRSFNPENTVSVKEAILLYEKVLGKSAEDTGMDIKQKAKKLALDDIFSLNAVMRDISKEQTAALIMRIYSRMTGVDENRLKPGANIYIKDEGAIGDGYYKYVTAAVDLGLLTLDDNGGFNPKEAMTRASIADVFVKLLELAGEVTL